MKDTRNTRQVAVKSIRKPHRLDIGIRKGLGSLLLLPVQVGTDIEKVVMSDELSAKGSIRFSEISTYLDQLEGRFLYQPFDNPFAFAIRFLHSDKFLLVPRWGSEREDCRKLYEMIRRNLGEPASPFVYCVRKKFATDGSPVRFVFVAFHDDDDPAADHEAPPQKHNSRQLTAA